MRHCENCEVDFTNPTCPLCGARPASRRQPRTEDVPRHSTFVSDPDDTMDHMVQQASRPTLASLVKRGLKKGLIKPIHDYASKNGK